MYTTSDKLQMKDFLLEPGTIVADLDATDEMDYATYGAGTPSNDLLRKINLLEINGGLDAADALRDSIVNAGETGVLALYLSDGHGATAAQGLVVLDLLIDGQTGAIIFRDRTKDIATIIPALFED